MKSCDNKQPSYIDRLRCGYCGKYCDPKTTKWQTEYSYNPPDVLDDYPVCKKCAEKRSAQKEVTI